MEIHKVLKNGPKIKVISSFERVDYIEPKYIIDMSFEFFEIP